MQPNNLLRTRTFNFTLCFKESSYFKITLVNLMLCTTLLIFNQNENIPRAKCHASDTRRHFHATIESIYRKVWQGVGVPGEKGYPQLVKNDDVRSTFPVCI